MLHCPYKLLIGPLRGLDDDPYTMSLNSEIGDYIHSPNIKAFSQIPGQKKGLGLTYQLSHFNHILEQLPPDWTPDVVIWWDMTLHAIPPGIEDCPYPTIGVAGDWYMNIDNLVHYAKAFDHILGDRHILKILKANQIENCSYWPCFGFDHHLFYREPCETLYDISFVGHLNARIHQKRNQLLERLSRLGDTYQVFIGDGIFGKDCRKVFNQSRIVFNYAGVAQVMNKRAYEAPACGSLLFMEESNQEIEYILPDEVGCVLYNEDNLEERLSYYLNHETLRAKIAQKGYESIQAHSYQNKFTRLLQELPSLLQNRPSTRSFKQLPYETQLLTVAKQLYYPVTVGSSDRAIAHLQPYFNDATPKPNPYLLNIWAVLLLQDGQRKELYQLIETLFLQALNQIKHPSILLNLGSLFQKMGKVEQALDSYHASITSLENEPWESKDFENFTLYYNNETDSEAQEALNLIILWERAYFTHIKSPQLKRKTYTHLLLWYNWLQIGKLYQQQDKNNEALKAIEKAIENCLTISKTHVLKGILHLNLTQYSQAINAYQQAFSHNPFQAKILLVLVQLLHRESHFQSLQALLSTHWNLWTTSTVFRKVKEELMAYFHYAHFKQFEDKSKLKHYWSNQLLNLFNKDSQLSYIAEPLPISLSLNTLESLPPISKSIATFTSREQSKIHIGEETHPDYPTHYRRSWDFSGDIQKGLLGPKHLPYLFPQNLPDLKLDFDNKSTQTILVLIKTYKNPLIYPLITEGFKQFGKNYHYYLWSPFHIPQEQDLEYLEANLPKKMIEQMELIMEDFSIAEQASFIQSFDYVLGNINFYLWWALSLNQPAIFYTNPINPYDTLPDSIISSLTFPIISLQKVNEQTTFIYHFLLGYQQKSLTAQIEQLLWQLKIESL